MTQKLTLQIALMVLVASAIALVLIGVGGGLAGSEAVDMGQIIPLAVASAAAFVVILANPFDRAGV